MDRDSVSLLIFAIGGLVEVILLIAVHVWEKRQLKQLPENSSNGRPCVSSRRERVFAVSFVVFVIVLVFALVARIV